MRVFLETVKANFELLREAFIECSKIIKRESLKRPTYVEVLRDLRRGGLIPDEEDGNPYKAGQESIQKKKGGGAKSKGSKLSQLTNSV